VLRREMETRVSVKLGLGRKCFWRAALLVTGKVAVRAAGRRVERGGLAGLVVVKEQSLEE